VKAGTDFDPHSDLYKEHGVELMATMRREEPIFWTSAHGGMWVVTKYHDISKVLRDPATFSSGHDLPGEELPGCPRRLGTTTPEAPGRFIPVELDPPEYQKFVHIVNIPLLPPQVERVAPKIREAVRMCLDRVIGTGRIDLVEDLGNPVPAIVTLGLLGLPLDDWERFAMPFHILQSNGADAPEHTYLDLLWIRGRLQEEAMQRRSNPRDDHLSTIATATVDGEFIDPETLADLLMLLLGAGVETTAALIAASLLMLDDDRGARERLIETPDLIPTATDEFLRLHSVAQQIARTAMSDVELGGVSIRAGDRLMLMLSSANRDELVFTDPDTMLLDRHPNRHIGYSAGLHRCKGATLAKRETSITIEEVLKTIPDYVVDRSGVETFATVGQFSGWAKMPATFSARSASTEA
jgi:cytochrome P450